ncbi:MAG: glycosyltransferase [Actinobacteria bacterium]|nr:glycosyltransferase [Actinomycetota bacterium]
MDQRNEYTEDGWEFLRPMLAPYIDQYVFTRREYAPSWVPNERLHVIKPSLDPFAPKNRELDQEHILAILEHIGILRSDSDEPIGNHAPVERVADIVSEGPRPSADDQLVVQVSRWDPLKDMAGVMRGFLADPGCAQAYLVLAGPDVSSVSDDPEGQGVLADVIEQWKALPEADRQRIQIVCLPMDDPEENAFMVNALQRHAAIVVQKSLKEGFGLTVTEAMLKGRPVVASAVGGIVDQIRDGVDGILIQDPRDPVELGAALAKLLSDPEAAATMGREAKAAVVSQFLPDSSLNQWGQALDSAIGPVKPS